MKLNNEQRKTIEQLQEAYNLVFEANRAIFQLNRNGNQFDYVTHPELSEAIDRLLDAANNVEKKVYQKVKIPQ